MRSPWVLSAVLAGIAGPALSACPAAPQDVAAGVTVTYADGAVAEFVRGDDGLVTERTAFNDGTGEGSFFRSVRGLQFVELASTKDGEIVPDSKIRRTYALGLDWYFEFGRPVPEETYSTEITVEESGSDPFTERHSYTTGTAETRDWGGCIYEVLPVRVRYDLPDGEQIEHYDYVPALDLAVFRGITGDMLSPPGLEPVAIATAPSGG